jgi:hypothetical protein
MQSRTKGRTSRAAYWGGNLQTEIIGNMVPVNADLHTQQNLFEKYPHFSMFSQDGSPAVLDQKYLRNIGFKKRQIISLAGVNTCLEPALESCSYPKVNTCLGPALESCSYLKLNTCLRPALESCSYLIN